VEQHYRKEKRKTSRATALQPKNLPTEPARKGNINAIVAYKMDNAAVANHQPREDGRASSRNSGKTSANEDQMTMAVKYLPSSGPARSRQQASTKRGPKRQQRQSIRQRDTTIALSATKHLP